MLYIFVDSQICRLYLSIVVYYIGIHV